MTNIHRNLLCVLLLVSAAACKDIETENMPPKAVVEVLIDGKVVDTKLPIPFEGDPIEIVLSGKKSSDEDGSIDKYEWRRTDVSAAARNGTVDGGVPFEGDPKSGQTATVVLGEGSYRFTLYVTDDDGVLGTPVSVSLTVMTALLYNPDAECVAAYEGANADCEACVCAPPEEDGCLDLFDNCFNNADATFSTLCKAVYDCGIAKSCLGSACYAAPLCMAEIDAAATYMGGTLANCSDAATAPTANPCRAVSTLSGCINTAEIAGLPRETCSALCAP